MELKIPVHIDGFECVKDIINAVLDHSYKGRTLKEWVDNISNPITNADHIRAMSDEELAELLRKNRGGCRALTTESYICDFYTDDLNTDCKACWLNWLKQEVDEAKG